MAERQHILLGAGSHAKVLLDIMLLTNTPIVGVCDPALAAEGKTVWRDIQVLGDDKRVQSLASEHVLLVNGLGQLPRKDVRFRFHEQWLQRGYQFASLIHPTVCCSPSAFIGAGAQIMAGVILQTDAKIGEGSIINTNTTVDHDCTIGAHVHISAGVTVCGGVTVADHVFIGAGTVIAHGVKIGERAIVGAGSVVMKDVPSHGFAVGFHG